MDPKEIAKLITEDVDDVLTEGRVREIIQHGLQKLKGQEESFVQKLHTNIGTQGLLDLADDLANGDRPATKYVLKELLLWVGVPIAGAMAAHAMGLPWTTGVLLKSAVWLGMVQVLQATAKSKESTSEKQGDTKEPGSTDAS